MIDIVKTIKDLLYEIIFGSCDNCYYGNNCSHIKYGGGHCWDNSYEPHYKRKGI